ncbi:GTP cyclohydrolase II [Candidatus Nomurabacteria bacterium]|nr:GTP cyclohydrolase II [Candidatus Nomurabacteria bacterium]
MKEKVLIKKETEVKLPTKYGDFVLYAYSVETTGEQHLALVKGRWEKDEAVLARIHSSCMTGDVFGSLRCDCGPQLEKAMQIIETEGKGVILYLNQEGRGIGLINKLKAYKLQENGSDTVEANLELGFKMDERDYGVGAEILRDLGISKIKLLSNNPDKMEGLKEYGLEVVENIPIQVESNIHNIDYLLTKRDKMNHKLNLD